MFEEESTQQPQDVTYQESSSSENVPVSENFDYESFPVNNKI